MSIIIAALPAAAYAGIVSYKAYQTAKETNDSLGVHVVKPIRLVNTSLTCAAEDKCNFSEVDKFLARFHLTNSVNKSYDGMEYTVRKMVDWINSQRTHLPLYYVTKADEIRKITNDRLDWWGEPDVLIYKEFVELIKLINIQMTIKRMIENMEVTISKWNGMLLTGQCTSLFHANDGDRKETEDCDVCRPFNMTIRDFINEYIVRMGNGSLLFENAEQVAWMGKYNVSPDWNTNHDTVSSVIKRYVAHLKKVLNLTIYAYSS